MSEPGITKLGVPKWGLSMREGKLVAWLVEEGAAVTEGQELAEVETEKINGIVEAPVAGVLRRRVAQIGETRQVGALLGVIAGETVPDGEIEAFVAEFEASFVPEEAGAEAGPAAERLTVAGRELRFLSLGEGGEPAVLLHGFGGDLDSWLFNQEALADERRVVALELPGHGESTKDVGSGDLESFVGVLADAVSALGLGRVHLIGHSLGGTVAAGFAIRHADSVASLCLIAPAGLGPEVNGEYIEGFVGAASRRELKPWLELLFADAGVVTRQLVDDVLRYKRIDGVDGALRTVAGQFFPDGRQAYDIGPRLGEVEAPILAIWGEEDRVIPAAHVRALPAGATVAVLADQGHSPHMEAAGEVNRLLGDFLSGVGRA